MVDDLIRLLLRPEAMSDTQVGTERFHASREDDGLHVVTSSQPLYAGAKVLLEGGTLPSVLLTCRHVGKSFDSFSPHPIGPLATGRLGESRSGLRFRSHQLPPRRRSP